MEGFPSASWVCPAVAGVGITGSRGKEGAQGSQFQRLKEGTSQSWEWSCSVPESEQVA